MSELLISHTIGKSFLKYGFTISIDTFEKRKELILNAYKNAKDVIILYQGKQYTAKIDHGNGRKGLYRVMFRTDFRNKIKEEYAFAYETYLKEDGSEDIRIKSGVDIEMGFYSTDKEYVWEAKEISGCKDCDMEILRKFKKLLEYYCTHLTYIVNNDKNIRGYDEYLKPYIDNNTFKKAGQGWRGQTIQDQIANWENYPAGKICINVYGSSFQSYASYLHWVGTGHNISANWDGNNIESFELIEYRENETPNWITAGTKYSIKELGLYDGKSPNECIKSLYQNFVAMQNVSSVSNNSDIVSYPEQKIYYGAPGCGKSHYIETELKKYSFDIKKLSAEETQVKFEAYLDMSLKTSDQYKKAISHPDFLAYFKSHTKENRLKNIYSFFEVKDTSIVDGISSYDDFESINRHSKASSNGALSASLTKYSAFLRSDNSNNVFRTTFHPDYDFSSFVGTYKPMMVTDKDGKRNIEYNFAPQVFTDAYVYAWKNPAVVVFLVIEEINRGNCAQIFGDLFQLLDRNKSGESEYPIKANIDLRRYLEEDDQLGKNGKGIENGELKLPRNLNILATMNTSDQSLFPMDSAFKRRWQWKYMKIDYDNAESDEYTIYIDDDHQYKWNEFLQQVNKRIYDLTKSEDKQLGNFFVKGEIDTETFIEKVMFFLWSEICKEEVGNKRSFYFTTYRFDKDSPEGQDKWEFKFSDLFNADAEQILIGFMEFLKVDVI